MIEAFVFDVDGTLADSERDGHRVAFNLAFAEAGLDWHWDEDTYGALLSVTGGKERIRHFARTRGLLQDLDPQFDALLHAAKTRHYVALLEGHAIALRAGVERLLNEAREAGIRLAIATTTTPQNVAALLASTIGEHSIGWFEVIGAGDVVPRKKPAPDIYRYVLAKMRLDARQCLAFEDSGNGLRASLGAGLKTVITRNGYTRDDDFTGAALVLDSLGDTEHPSQVLRRQYGRDCLCVTTLLQLLN
ncbi:MAG: HAD-IA family hydrolase [Gammaproteobacteria bacterium]|nr:HAD-IA family hydrolase [Gammaproteobacteria bacterium]